MRAILLLAGVVTVSSVAVTTLGQTTQPSEYATAMGPLIKTNWSLAPGSKIDFGGTIVAGAVEVAKGCAVPLGSNYFPLAPDMKMDPPPRITFVQETGTGQWLATDGRLPNRRGGWVVVEGMVIKIVGGADSPIRIAGQAFSDTVVTIRNGAPEAAKAAQPPPPTLDSTSASSGSAAIWIAIGVIVIAAFAAVLIFKPKRARSQSS